MGDADVFRPGGERVVPPGPFGICAGCANQKLIRSGRGSVFSMCELHKIDDRFPKYPRMPVLECPGHRPLPRT